MTDIRTEGAPAVDGAEGTNGEAKPPEPLPIPAEAVGDLIQMALRSQEGNAWWRGFVTAHGTPAWLAAGAWQLAVGEAQVRPGAPRR